MKSRRPHTANANCVSRGLATDIVAAGVAGIVTAAVAGANLEYTAQARSLSTTASPGPCGETASNSIIAPDFEPFEESISSASVFSFSQSSQSSEFEPTSLSASGSTSTSAGGCAGSAYASGSSDFHIEFTVSEALDFTLQATVSGYVSYAMSGPSLNQSGGKFHHTLEETIDLQGVLLPGRYSITFTASAVSSSLIGHRLDLSDGSFSLAMNVGPSSYPIVAGVNQITMGGGIPGPLFPLSDAWSAVASGDDDTSFPNTVAMSREYGAGRVVMFGHDAILQATNLLDNAVLLANTANWLRGPGDQTAGYSSGHGEWVSGSVANALITVLSNAGFTTAAVAKPITPEKLEGLSVLFVGNAWGEFTANEIEVIRQWVEGGGGLCMAGLGWSWPSSLDTYPMTLVAAPYGGRWLPGAICDPSNSLGSCFNPVFHTFYPEASPIFTVGDAEAALVSAHETHGNSLMADLETDLNLASDVVSAHLTIAIPTYSLPGNHPIRQTVHDLLVMLAGLYPESYARSASFDESAVPIATNLRERFWQSWRDVLALSPEVIDEMVTVGHLPPLQESLLESFGVVLLDNDRLSPSEIGVIDTYLSLTSADLHNLRRISVKDYLGTPALSVPLTGVKDGVNVFGLKVGEAHENSFPPDVSPGIIDTFCVVMAHELNHVVDAFTISGTPALKARRDALIAAAGCESMNYLRSMFAPCFFVNAPQEFFASIANQWYADSLKTIELGLVRFDNAWLEPINQALFFAEVHSQGGNSFPLFVTDITGAISADTATLGRNEAGFINLIRMNGQVYTFDLSESGDVIRYAIHPVGDINGDSLVTGADLGLLLSNWNTSDAMADLNGDGVVDGADLGLLLGAWSPAGNQ